MKATMKNTAITEHADKLMTEIEVNIRQIISIINYPANTIRLDGRVEARGLVKDKIIAIFYTIQCKEYKVARIEFRGMYRR